MGDIRSGSVAVCGSSVARGKAWAGGIEDAVAIRRTGVASDATAVAVDGICVDRDRTRADTRDRVIGREGAKMLSRAPRWSIHSIRDAMPSSGPTGAG